MNDENRNRRGQRRRHRNNRPTGGSHGSGNRQRPLLTSAITAAGLSLVGLCVSHTLPEAFGGIRPVLGVSLITFALSAVISYFAQRLAHIKAVEKVSDVFFLTGCFLFILMGLVMGGFVAPLPSLM